MSAGEDVSEYFPYVVKNIVVPSLEVKKLVYTYLVHYAEFVPDMALMSISTFQKVLCDSSIC
jgi:AP-3 complex subunit beta